MKTSKFITLSLALLACASCAGTTSGRIKCETITASSGSNVICDGKTYESFINIFKYVSDNGQTIYTNHVYQFNDYNNQTVGNGVISIINREKDGLKIGNTYEYISDYFGFVGTKQTYYYHPKTRMIEIKRTYHKFDKNMKAESIDDTKTYDYNAYAKAYWKCYKLPDVTYPTDEQLFIYKKDVVKYLRTEHKYIHLSQDASVTYTIE